MRSLFLIISIMAIQWAKGQTFRVNYEKEVKMAAPNLFKKTFSYNTGGEKNARLLLENIKAADIKKLFFYMDDGEDELTAPQVETDENGIIVNLSEFQNDEKHLLHLKIKHGATEKELAIFTLEKGNDVGGTGKPDANEEEEVRADYWTHVQDSIRIELKQLYLTDRDKCCDTCTGCESMALKAADRIIYDALTGITYFCAAQFKSADLCAGCVDSSKKNEYNCFKVDNKHVIKLRANDPYIFQVKNVNPELYDVELADTSFLFFNESNPMTEKMLLGKSEGIDLHSRKGTSKDNNETYLHVRAGLVLLDAEMAGLLENLNMYSRFLYNCVTQRKQQALKVIDNYIQQTLGQGRFGQISFRGFVDIFLDPVSKKDSSLNRRLKMHYLAFQLSKYELAYRFARAPEHDQINFTLKIERKLNAPYPSLLTPKQPTQVAYVRNFFKVDVSSGLYYTNFRNEQYSVRADSIKVTKPGGAVEDSVGNKLVKENNGKGEIGFASYVHFYQKWGTTVNVGGVLGAGISFEENPQPRYFTGLSLMIGRSNRLCINGGLVWGNQHKLSDQYIKRTDGSFNWIPKGESEPKYIKKFQARGFISISYNLPFLKRKPTEVKAGPDNQPKKDDQKEEEKKENNKE
jgi:hypothetical protein